MEIRLDADQHMAFEAQRNKAVRSKSMNPSKFRVRPGLKGSGFVSLELAGQEHCYLRHQHFIIFLHEKPRKTNFVFEADASFTMVHVNGDKVRFEASNYPGMFITARSDGSVILEKEPPHDECTFILAPTTE